MFLVHFLHDWDETLWIMPENVDCHEKFLLKVILVVRSVWNGEASLDVLVLHGSLLLLFSTAAHIAV